MITYEKILSAIPSYANEIYLSDDDKVVIAKEIHEKLKDKCEHSWGKADIKLVDTYMCKKCGKIETEN